jgi:hypothetical protein
MCRQCCAGSAIDFFKISVCDQTVYCVAHINGSIEVVFT